MSLRGGECWLGRLASQHFHTGRYSSRLCTLYRSNHVVRIAKNVTNAPLTENEHLAEQQDLWWREAEGDGQLNP